MRRALTVTTLALVLLTVLLVLAPGAGAALPPEGAWTWTQPYVLPGTAPIAQLLAVGPDGSVYVGGNSWAAQWVVSRVDANGVQLWTQTTLGPDDAGASPLVFATDAKRNLVVAGYSELNGRDFYVVKYKAADGSVLWQKRWNGKTGGADVPAAVALDKSGNVYVAGATASVAGPYDGVVVKYDAAGRKKWTYTLATAKYDDLTACGVDRYGNLYATGQRNGEMGESEIVTVKLSPSGRRVWQRIAGGLGVNYNGRFLRVRGTSVTVVGEVNVYGTKPVILRYTLAGKRTWVAANTPTTDSVHDAVVDGKGRVVLVGGDRVSFGGDPAIRVGELQVYEPGEKWPGTSSLIYGDFDTDLKYPMDITKVVVDSAGRIYCAGIMYTSATYLEANAVVVRFPSTDTTPWTGADAIWRYDGPASGVDEFQGLLRASDTAIYASGYRRVGGGGMEGILHRLDTVPDL